jgi:hypothetical protein
MTQIFNIIQLQQSLLWHRKDRRSWARKVAETKASFPRPICSISSLKLDFCSATYSSFPYLSTSCSCFHVLYSRKGKEPLALPPAILIFGHANSSGYCVHHQLHSKWKVYYVNLPLVLRWIRCFSLAIQGW